MLLFFVSFLLVLISSYFITALVDEKDFRLKLLYYFLTIIAQVILTFETLSLFHLITPAQTILFNTLILLISFKYWNKKDRPIFEPQKNPFNFKKLLWALKTDKLLLLIALGFVFSTLTLIFMAIFTVSAEGDLMSYHLPRVAAWAQYHTLAHYETTTIRQIVFPINQHLLILWPMIFLKNDFLSQFTELLPLFGSYLILWFFLSDLKLSFKRKLWSLMFLASFPIIIIQSISLQGQIFTGFLLFTAFYLFFKAYKEGRTLPAIFSAIASAIAIGAKSSSFFFIPVFLVIFGFMAYRENKIDENLYKIIKSFILAFIIGFIVLSSFNYILNIMDFGSPFGPKYFLRAHSAIGGAKTLFSNLIRNSFLLIDFSGFDYVLNPIGELLSKIWLFGKNSLLGLFGLKNAFIANDPNKMNYTIAVNIVGMGITGLFVLIPLCLKRSIIAFSSKGRSFYLSVLGWFFPLFILALSALMSFWCYNVRFFATVLILCSPILAFTYRKSFSYSKLLLSLIIFLNLFLITLRYPERSLVYDVKLYKEYKTISAVRDYMRIYSNAGRKEIEINTLLKFITQNIPAGSNLGIINSDRDNYLFYTLGKGYKINFIDYSKYVKHPENYKKFDYLIALNEFQCNSLFDEKNIEFNYDINTQNHSVEYFQDALNQGIIIYLNIMEAPTKNKDEVYIKKYYYNFYLFNKYYKFMTSLSGDNDYKFYIYVNKEKK